MAGFLVPLMGFVGGCGVKGGFGASKAFLRLCLLAIPGDNCRMILSMEDEDSHMITRTNAS